MYTVKESPPQQKHLYESIQRTTQQIDQTKSFPPILQILGCKCRVCIIFIEIMAYRIVGKMEKRMVEFPHASINVQLFMNPFISKPDMIFPE